MTYEDTLSHLRRSAKALVICVAILLAAGVQTLEEVYGSIGFPLDTEG